jgi:hypothetical protein
MSVSATLMETSQLTFWRTSFDAMTLGQMTLSKVPFTVYFNLLIIFLNLNIWEQMLLLLWKCQAYKSLSKFTPKLFNEIAYWNQYYKIIFEYIFSLYFVF